MPLRITKVEWKAEADRRYGKGPWSWKFRCPCCQKVFHATAWMDPPSSRIRELEAANKCPDETCGYHGTESFFNLNPITVHHPDFEGDPEQSVWDFADEPLCP